MISKITLVEV
jgi:protein unc-119